MVRFFGRLFKTSSDIPIIQISKANPEVAHISITSTPQLRDGTVKKQAAGQFAYFFKRKVTWAQGRSEHRVIRDNGLQFGNICNT